VVLAGTELIFFIVSGTVTVLFWICGNNSVDNTGMCYLLLPTRPNHQHQAKHSFSFL